MKNDESRLLREALLFEEGHPRRTQHILKVYALAKLFGEQEGLSRREQRILRAAAILHDIAIKPCKEKYGDACQENQRREAAQIDPWGGLVCAASLGFGGVGAWAANAGCGHTTTKPGGFQKGAWPPLCNALRAASRLRIARPLRWVWHTTLLARCSVLYLLARLTGEAGDGAIGTLLAPAG